MGASLILGIAGLFLIPKALTYISRIHNNNNNKLEEEEEEGEGEEEEDWLETDTAQLQKRIADVQAQLKEEKKGMKKRSITYKSEPASFA